MTFYHLGGNDRKKQARYMPIFLFLLIILAVSPTSVEAQGNWKLPSIALTNVPVNLTFDNDSAVCHAPTAETIISAEKECSITFAESGIYMVALQNTIGETLQADEITVVPGWLSLLPALLAIGSALIFRQVLIALFLGIFIGAFIIKGGGFSSFLPAILAVADTYLLRALVPEDGNTEHMAVVLFTLMTGGMIGIISKNGGMEGLIVRLKRFAHTPRRAQIATAGLGGLIFFDDYANTLIVGNTMRPLADRLKISREKLAFIVDSTAAPLAAIALITTWIGFQLSLIDNSLSEYNLPEGYAYSLFLSSIPYSFYPLLMLLFVGLTIATGRDFGPMLKAEKRSRLGEIGDEHPVFPDKQEVLYRQYAANALVPILVLIGGTFTGLWVTGGDGSVADRLGNADPFVSILWGSLLSLIAALIMTLITRSLSLKAAIDAMERGFTPMLLAVMILTFAWGIADVNAHMHTADYLISLLGESTPMFWLPAFVFLLAGFTSFATGSSWGVMAILIPLVLPLGMSILQAQGVSNEAILLHPLFAASLASVLSGAVWGDHCSPISDTTILSSLASGCDHIQHVHTQLPYALSVGGISVFVGLGSTALDWPVILSLGVSAIFVTLLLVLCGERST
jgi:Na+/H+ antiporter NhaC